MTKTKTVRWGPTRMLAGLCALLACSLPVPADDTPLAAVENWPVISIIIDDLGMDNPRHEAIVRLPGAIACSFLPHAPATRRLARLAHSYNKEILLHLPMESVEPRELGPGGLSLDMTQQEFAHTLQDDLASVPHVSGINNHMGSLLTRHPGHMVWLMQEMKRNGKMFFVDSRTTHESIARNVADEQGVPSLDRDIFLDHDMREAQIEKQWAKTIDLAKRRGAALAIGHPHKNTLAVLQRQLPLLQEQGIRVVPVAEMIRLKKEREQTWHVYWSPSQKVVRSSKP